MYGSLFWIEWFDRLDRVLTGAGQDLLYLSRAMSPRGMAAIQRSMRLLSALGNNLRLLDRQVLTASADESTPDLADDLQKALDTAVFRLGSLSNLAATAAPAIRERMLAGIDAALRDIRYEADMLLEPRRRRA
jgi:hypothetical protein